MAFPYQHWTVACSYKKATRLTPYSFFINDFQTTRRLGLVETLKLHNGCVNTIAWNCTGTMLISGSDDLKIVLSDPFARTEIFSFRPRHNHNIFAARFLPFTNDEQIISCCGGGVVMYNHIQRPELFGDSIFKCHQGTTFDVITIPGDSTSFLSCGSDSTVRIFDIRLKSKCVDSDCTDDVLLSLNRAVSAIAINKVKPFIMGAATADGKVRLFDRRMIRNDSIKSTESLDEVASLCLPVQNDKSITSLTFSPNGKTALVSYSSSQLIMYDIENLQKISEFKKPEVNTSKESPKVDEKVRVVRPRLRLRGDWSDTGPNARPLSERDPDASRDVRERGSVGGNRALAVVSDYMRTIVDTTTAPRPTPVVTEGQASSRPSTVSREELPTDMAPVTVVGTATERQNEDEDGARTGTQREESARRARQRLFGHLVNAMFGVNDESDDDSEHDEATDQNADSAVDANRSESNANESKTAIDDVEPHVRLLQKCFRDKARRDSTLCAPAIATFSGHRNTRTMIKEANYWGDDFVMSGSDCGHIFIWEVATGRLVTALEGDTRVVNCVQPHPRVPCLASSGIDYDVKIWWPVKQLSDVGASCDGEFDGLVERNRRFLSESHSTITVPPRILLRLLSTLTNQQQQNDTASNDEEDRSENQ